MNSYYREQRKQNPEAMRQYWRENYLKNIESKREQHKRWRDANPDIVRAQSVKKMTNPLRRMAAYQSIYIRSWLFKYRDDFFIKDIGCDVATLKAHIEGQFKDGMTWENYGRSGWWIDHKVPMCSFNLADPEQRSKAFHYTNLQPLWWRENLEKGDLLPDGSRFAVRTRQVRPLG